MNIVIAAGGTAGHINPGISIANIIKKYYPDAKITFIGTEYGLEGKLVPKAGYDIKFIHSKGLSKNPIKLAKSIFANTRGICEAHKLLKELNPKVVIGMGGYVCAPVLFVAKKMWISYKEIQNGSVKNNFFFYSNWRPEMTDISVILSILIPIIAPVELFAFNTAPLFTALIAFTIELKSLVEFLT